MKIMKIMSNKKIKKIQKMINNKLKICNKIQGSQFYMSMSIQDYKIHKELYIMKVITLMIYLKNSHNNMPLMII